jgi:arrestin-related trafficking adapter 9
LDTYPERIYPHDVRSAKSMTSSPTRASTPSSSKPKTSRSLLSRLKSPLSSKSRNYTEFYIQSDDPHRQYAPGDIISGTVIIKIIKPLRITHLVVSLHGYAQVFKNPNAPGDAYKNYCTTVGSGKGKKAGSYFGNGFVSLFEDEVVLCGEGRLSEGVYHFNFELEFPSKGLPSSIDVSRSVPVISTRF